MTCRVIWRFKGLWWVR